MATELRKTGISVVGDAPWGTHYCHFYETKQDLLDTLVPYFKAGLESKEFCLWVVSNSDLITVEEAKGALGRAVPNFDRYLSDESIEIFNSVDWYLENKVFNLEIVTNAWDTKLERALALGYDGMRVSGDTFWLREKDWKDFCAYEKQVNDSIIDRPMTVLCTYPLMKSGAAEVFDVLQTHQFAVARRHGEWEIIESPELTLARAEIKRLNEALQRVKERTLRQPLILSYGAAVLSVAAALIIARWLEIHLVTAPVSLLLCAIMFSTWFGGVGPGLLSIALSLLAFDYYFVLPIHSFAIEIKEIPRLLVFTLSAVFVGSLSAAQRNKAESLRRAHDVLDDTVQQLKRTNASLKAKSAERARAEEALKATSEQLRALSASLRSAREEEGTRIARELHDELGSALASLRWDLDEVDSILATTATETEADTLRRKIATMTTLVEGTVDTVRRISSELRPSILDHIGLVATIEWETQKFEARTGISCHFEPLVKDIQLTREQSTAVFRIFQESLTNVLRHADATTVDVVMEGQEREFVLQVEDNGKGIKEAEISGTESLGLLGMRERAHLIGGEVSITSAEGRGTVVTVRVPIGGSEVVPGSTQ